MSRRAQPSTWWTWRKANYSRPAGYGRATSWAWLPEPGSRRGRRISCGCTRWKNPDRLGAGTRAKLGGNLRRQMSQEILSIAVFEPYPGEEEACLATLRELIGILTSRNYSRDESPGK